MATVPSRGTNSPLDPFKQRALENGARLFGNCKYEPARRRGKGGPEIYPLAATKSFLDIAATFFTTLQSLRDVHYHFVVGPKRKVPVIVGSVIYCDVHPTIVNQGFSIDDGLVNAWKSDRRQFAAVVHEGFIRDLTDEWAGALYDLLKQARDGRIPSLKHLGNENRQRQQFKSSFVAMFHGDTIYSDTLSKRFNDMVREIVAEIRTARKVTRVEPFGSLRTIRAR